jgi:hypothetical protein
MWEFDDKNYMARVLSPAERARAAGEPLPDYFTRYALPLDADDINDISKALKRVAMFWAQTKLHNPRFQHVLKLLGDEHPAATAILTDKAKRDAARKAAAAAVAERAARRFVKVEQVIALLAGKGYITPAELKLLLDEFVKPGELTEEEVLSRVKVPIKETPPEGPKAEPLPNHVWQQICNSLQLLKRPNLYAFLGVASPLSKDKLKAACEKASGVWLAKPPTDERASAEGLLANIQTYLVDGDPARYEASRLAEVKRELRTMVLLAAEDKRVTAQEYEAILKYAASRGYESAIAAQAVMELAAELGAVVESVKHEEEVACPNCRKGFSAASKPLNCDVCGANMWRDCPRCANRAPAMLVACGKCGLRFDDLEKLDGLVREAEKAIEENRLGDAIAKEREASGLWSEAPNLVSLRTKIRAREEELKRLRADVEKAFSQKRFYATGDPVRTLVARAAGYAFPDGKTAADLGALRDERLKRVEERIAAAKACESRGDVDGAAMAYEEALSIASDCADAERGLKRHPPAPAGAPKATLTPTGIRLDWGPSPSGGALKYTVVRKADGPPSGISDGAKVTPSPIAGRSCEDRNVAAGSTVHYAVFVERFGVQSPPACSDPVLCAAEVTGVRSTVGDRTVEFTWKEIAKNATMRACRRTDRPPKDAADGDPIVSVAGTKISETGLKNGQIYHYHISLEYRADDGGVVRTKGLGLSVTPDAPPVAVGELRTRAEGSGILLEWDKPAGGTVRIYRGANQGIKPATRVELTALAGLGIKLANRDVTRAVDPQPPPGISNYLAVSEGPEYAIAGAARLYVAQTDVSGVQGLDLGSEFQIHWQWPPETAFVAVGWSHDSYPEDPAGKGVTSRLVSRSDYETHNCFQFSDPEPKSYYFTIFAGVEANGQRLYSPGIRLDARKEFRTTTVSELSYTVEQGSFTRKSQVKVALQSSQLIRLLPDLVLLVNPTNLPRSATDGQPLLRIRNRGIGPKQTVDFTLEVNKRPTFVRMFFVDPARQGDFYLKHPPPDDLRIK